MLPEGNEFRRRKLDSPAELAGYVGRGILTEGMCNVTSFSVSSYTCRVGVYPRPFLV